MIRTKYHESPARDFLEAALCRAFELAQEQLKEQNGKKHNFYRG